MKNYLVQYCEERKQAGFVIARDPLSIFYEALCVGLDMDENLTTDDFPQPPPNNSGLLYFHLCKCHGIFNISFHLSMCGSE